MPMPKFLLPLLIISAFACSLWFGIQAAYAPAPLPNWIFLIVAVPFAFCALVCFWAAFSKIGAAGNMLPARIVASVSAALFVAAIVASIWNALDPDEKTVHRRFHLLVAACLTAAVARVIVVGRWKKVAYAALPFILIHTVIQFAADANEIRNFIPNLFSDTTLGTGRKNHVDVYFIPVQSSWSTRYNDNLDGPVLLSRLVGLLSLALPTAALLASITFPGRADRIGPVAALSLLGSAAILVILPHLDIDSPETRTALVAVLHSGLAALALLFIIAAVFPRRPPPSESTSAYLDLTCPRCRTAQTLAVGETRCRACRLQIEIRLEEPRCPTCNYLLFRLTQPRCPECGTSVPDLELPSG